MAFIGFYVLMVTGFLLVVVGCGYFGRCLVLGSENGESLFGVVIIGFGVGVWCLAVRYASFSLVMS